MAPSDLPPVRLAPHGRLALATALRVVGSIGTLLLAYYVLPLDRERDLPPALVLGIALGAVVVVFGMQVRAITRSPRPAIRAVEALGVTIPLLLVTFAATYFVMSESNIAAFTEPLTRTTSLYFTVTTFSTVGFGDITPRTDTARLLVSFQMILDLVVLGVGLRIVFGAVRLGRERQGKSPGEIGPADFESPKEDARPEAAARTASDGEAR